ncbi:hypothetical protein CLV51_102765 [Chitinophaga niastensis]|uniref:DUF748 domain-containing protein n=1 Tax=Chitinophaga niastensis TaxID=536980 RepID=A0A2P8HNW1_CHINA|nr:hypothetical protein [Chitinophaga niastensis]PSL47905.1 hypothetical protein CLV51_102765 [Chitinophaga niastensis]
MKISSKQKKWIKWLLILLLIRIVAGGLLYYITVYKFKEIAKYAVKKESNDTYEFDAGDIDVSLWNKNITLNHVILFCKDTLHADSHYDVKIPRVYLSIQSWKDLIFNKKLSVDSLSILRPQLMIHEHVARKSIQGNFQLSNILNNLENTLQYVNARIIHLQDGSFTYSRLNGPAAPLHVDHFNFSIVNFSSVTSSDNHILGSDDVDFSFDNQQWILPDGRNTISFKRLHFSGRKQVFELDSCTIFSAATPDKGEMSLNADKFYFSARHLPAIYMREELLIDTLVCIKPVLKFPGTKTTAKGSPKTIDSISTALFKKINIKYITVKDGALLLRGNTTTGSTQKTNVSIYNLTIMHDSTPAISTDSIQLNLNKIKFYSLDSMFQLTVDEFTLHHNDVIFENVVYEPTPMNHTGKGLTFVAPILLLKNVSLEELLRKRLKADDAELHQPRITYLNKQKRKIKAATDTTVKMAAFYQTLHGLSELIQVNNFHITDGNVNFKFSGKSSMVLSLKSVNTDILLHKFFMSDSLVDIKHAMPDLHIKEVSIQSDKIKVLASNYVFDGLHRQNRGERLEVSLPNGTIISGKHFYWEVFDWDVFQKTKDIQIDVLRIGELNINAHSTPEKPHSSKNLPVIRIARLDINNLQFHNAGIGIQAHFNATNISLSNIRTKQQFITWARAAGQFYNISIDNEKMKATSAAIILNSNGTTRIENVNATIHNANGYTKLQAPVLTLQTNIHTTDVRHLAIHSLTTDQPQIEIYTTGTPEKQQQKAVPLHITMDKLLVNNADVHYTKVNIKDTTSLHTNITVTANAMHLNSDRLLQYNNAAIDITQLQLNNNTTALTIPQLTLSLAKGHITKDKANHLVFISNVSLKWNNINMHLRKADSMELAIERLSGMFNDAGFTFWQQSKLPWQTFADNTTIIEGGIYYKNRKINIQARSFSRDPVQNTFHVYDYSVTPNLSPEETFRITKWQRDYITVKGAALTISGIRFNHLPTDTTITIKKIIVDKTALTTARDKRIPFEHGIEKGMPTKLIYTIPFALHVDSIIVQQSAVTVNESSKANNKWAAVPITDITASITNFGNTYTAKDSLLVVASGRLLDNPIHYFSYSESYGDSLSSFYAQSYLAPIQLTDFNSVAIPMAAVKVKRGYADTIYSNWSGNKYATLGTMNFYYNRLNVQVLNKKDATKRGFMANLKTLLVNAILRNANHTPSRIFFIRDTEKFIFNYWVKAETSGMVTAMGVKKNKKYLKRYNKVAKQYSLPKR